MPGNGPPLARPPAVSQGKWWGGKQVGSRAGSLDFGFHFPTTADGCRGRPGVGHRDLGGTPADRRRFFHLVSLDEN